MNALAIGFYTVAVVLITFAVPVYAAWCWRDR